MSLADSIEQLVTLGKQYGRELTEKAYKAACALWGTWTHEDAVLGKQAFYDAAVDARQAVVAEEEAARKAKAEAEKQAKKYAAPAEETPKVVVASEEGSDEEVPEWKKKKKARKASGAKGKSSS